MPGRHLVSWHVICSGSNMGGIYPYVAALVIFWSNGIKAQESSEILYADSFYKTASGAIGPQNIVASNTYRIKIKGIEEMVIDSILVGQQKILGCGLKFQSENGLIDLTIMVATHQNTEVWYTGRIMQDENTTYACDVEKFSKVDTPTTEGAMVLFGHTEKTFYKLVKSEFDQQHSQFNK